MAKRKADSTSNTALLDAPPAPATRSSPAPAEPDIVDRVAGQFVDALRAAHAAVERMNNQSRTNPFPQEMLVFRAVGWDRLLHPGRALWQRQLGKEANRAELRDILPSPADRQESRDSLAEASKAYEAKSPALLAEIAKLQGQLSELSNAVDDTQESVTRQEKMLQRAADASLLPEHVEVDFTRARAAAKRDAAFAPWWEMQGRADVVATILTRDPMSFDDCNLLKHHIQRECPEGIKANRNNEIVDIFMHEAIAAWFGELRRELAGKLPAIEKGKAELAAKLAEIDRSEKSWFVDDHDRRLAEQTK